MITMTRVSPDEHARDGLRAVVQGGMSRMGTAVDTPKACCAQALHCAGEADKRLRRPGRLQTDHAKRAMGFGSIIAQGLGNVRLMGQAQEANRQVPQGGHDTRGGFRADLGPVFVKGDIPDPVQAILDGPVPPVQLQQPLRRRPLRRRGTHTPGKPGALVTRAPWPGDSHGDDRTSQVPG